MPLAKSRIMFTYEDLKTWEPDNYRHEIIAGEHFISLSPTRTPIFANLNLDLSKIF